MSRSCACEDRSCSIAGSNGDPCSFAPNLMTGISPCRAALAPDGSAARIPALLAGGLAAVIAGSSHAARERQVASGLELPCNAEERGFVAEPRREVHPDRKPCRVPRERDGHRRLAGDVEDRW